ncbi:MAG TPA: thymidine phosphorylase [Anaerolineales bacterium]|nr:thymidine phosphorylase [Anaerolineae bacterium]HIQ00722.1 thymidine phosphorylase [Anaerolineales bacterium]
MHAVDIIIKKRDGHELTTEEIEFFIQGYTRGEIPDYQAAAWLMAVYLRGMSDRETRDLTLAMARSGDVLDLKEVAPVVVDKHSSGGVGDKVSLVVAPTVAACGLPVGKMTGRGLGFTGGTVDKLESIPGYRTDLTPEEFKAQLAHIGIVLTGQSADLAPADRKLYALRDVIGVVSSIPLIVSSIMSKKIAAGADGILLDIKVGSGALVKAVEEAVQLAETMVRIGTQLGRRMRGLISDMNQPLGWAVGNALEVREAIDVLHEGGPTDLREHCLVVAAEMLALGGIVVDSAQGIEMAADAIATGKAWQKFLALVEAQGGDVATVEEPDHLPQARLIEPVPAPGGGYLQKVNAAEVGLALMDLGGGREKKEDPIDHAVGVVTHYKVGDEVQAETPLFTIHANDETRLAAARERLLAAHTIGPEPVEPLPLFYQSVG